MDTTECPSKDKEPRDPRRTVKTLEEALPGSVLEAQDKFGKWFLAKVVETDEEEGEVLVHFSGWSSRFDEWVTLNSNRLRTPSKDLLEQQELKRQRSLCVGDRVQAKWAGDKRLYFGKITQIFKATSKVEVLFDDGVKVVVPMVDVRKRKQDLVAKTTLAATAVKDASSKALAEARRRRALKRRRDDDKDEPAASSPLSPTSASTRRKQQARSRTDNDNTTETESEAETSSQSVELGNVSSASAGAVGTTPDQSDEKVQALPTEGSGEAARMDSEEEVKSSGKDGQRKVPLDTPKRSRSVRVTVVHSLEQASLNQSSSSPRASSGDELNREEPPSLDLKKDHYEVSILPNSPKLAPSPKVSQLPTSNVATPLQPGAQSSKTGSVVPLSPLSRPKVIVSPVAKVLERNEKEAQDKEDAAKVLGPLRKRSSHRSSETDSDADSTPRSRQHGGRLRLAPPESKKKRLIAASSMVTRTQKRVEKNIIKSAHERPCHLAPKEHVVVWDHNDFKCHFTGCNKSFRKETLLSSHLRHYHNVVDKTEKTVVKVVPKPKPAVSKPVPAADGASLKSPVQETKKSAETVAEPSPPGKQEGSVDGSKRKAVVKTSPRKTKIKAEMEGNSPSDVAKTVPILPRVTVPNVETASAVCPKSMNLEPVPIVKQENSELYRQRGNLRTIPRASLSEELEDDVLTEEDTEEEEGMRNKDDVVHCICGSSVDEGFMIQCDQCLCWQHGDCIGISQCNLPDKYLCPVCANPPGMRQRMKHKFSQMWFAEGHLPSLPGGPPFQHEKAMALSHQISEVLHHIRKMLHCTKIKIQALNSPNHPYLKQWAKECSRMTPQEIQALLLRTVGPTICSASNEPPTATNSAHQHVFNGLTHQPAQSSSSSSLRRSSSISPTVPNDSNGQSERSVESVCTSSSLPVVSNHIDASCSGSSPLCDPSLPHGTQPLANSSELPTSEHASYPTLQSKASLLASPQAVCSGTEKRDANTAEIDVVPVITSKETRSTTKRSCAMEASHGRTAVMDGGDDPEQVFSNEFGVQEMSVFALEEGKEPAKTETRATLSHDKDRNKVDRQNISPSSTSFAECYSDSGNRCLSGSEESVFAPDPLSPRISPSGDDFGSQAAEGEEGSRISPHAEAIIAEAAMELSLGTRTLEPRHWFNRLVLLDHINKVQDKILRWMDSLDKKIDSLPAGWSGDAKEHHSLLSEVHRSIQELETLRKGSTPV